MAEAVKQRTQGEPSWVENYVKQILQGTSRRNTKSEIEHEIIESSNDLTVKLKLPDKVNPRSLKLLVNHNSIKLNGLFEGKSHIIRLPKPVIGESAKAVFKKGVLIVRIPKEYGGDFFNEIRIRV
ncbi:hypothetical protein J2TS4_29810 [Paenibacillus sp. J2TS4]|nr:hypothetical protein J2TS4_29810 [Paenibacillus sp. J2TS4]